MRSDLFKTVGIAVLSFIVSTQVYAQDTTYARIIAAGAGGDLIFLDENYDEFATVATSNTKIYSIVDHYPNNRLHMVKVAPPPNSDPNFRPFYELQPFTGAYNGIVNFGSLEIRSSTIDDSGEVFSVARNANNEFLVSTPLSTDQEGEALALLSTSYPGDHGLIFVPDAEAFWYFRDSFGNVVTIINFYDDYDTGGTFVINGLNGMNISGGFLLDGKMILASSNDVYELDIYSNYAVTLLSSLSTEILTLETIQMLKPAPNHICVGDSIKLSSRFASQNYGWLKDGEPIENQIDYNLWVTEPGIYNLVCQIGTDGAHFIASETKTISLANQPVVTINGPAGDTLCPAGEWLYLYSSQNSGNQWYRNGDLLPGKTGNSLFVAQSGLYNVLVTNSFGCSDSSGVGIPIYQHEALLSLSLTASKPDACVGDSVLLVASGVDSYMWFANGTLMENEEDSIYIYSTGFYDVKAIDANGCTYTASTEWTPFYTTPSISLSLQQEYICPGDSTWIKAVGASSYEWYRNGEPLGLSTQEIYVTQPGNYNAIGFAGEACSDSANVGISIYKHPELLSLSLISSQQDACMGDSILLLASGSNSYIWYGNGVLIENEADSSIYIHSSGSYDVKTIDANGCPYIAGSEWITFYNNPSIGLSSEQEYICSGDSVWVKAEGANSYEWYFNGEPLGLSSQEIYANQPGAYNAIGLGAENCSDSSSTAVVLIEGTENQCVSGLATNWLDSEIRVFPNPTKSQITLEISKNSGVSPKVAKLFSSDGRQVAEYELTGNTRQVLILPENLSIGVYVLILTGKGFAYSKRIVVLP